MRKGQGSGTEDEFNDLLDEIIALVGFTRDKDVFRAFYASGLAKRLLLNKSASDDMERNMIVKLQNGGSRERVIDGGGACVSSSVARVCCIGSAVCHGRPPLDDVGRIGLQTQPRHSSWRASAVECSSDGRPPQ